MAYNLTNYTTATNLLDIATATNGVTSGLFFPIMLLMVLVVSFLSLKNYDSRVAFLTSTFITMIGGFFLFLVGLVSEGVLAISFTLFVISVVVNRL